VAFHDNLLRRPGNRDNSGHNCLDMDHR
jgi:hypothetical protein